MKTRNFSIKPGCFFLLLLSLQGMCGQYTLNIIAEAGHNGLMGMAQQVSINDLGRVAFIGLYSINSASSNEVWIGDGNGASPVSISPGFSSSTRSFSFPQINNSNVVCAKDQVSGVPLSTFVRTWPSDTIVVKNGAAPNNFDSVNLPNMNNSGQVSYVGLKGSTTSIMLNTGGVNQTLATYSSVFALRPMIDDRGNCIFRDSTGRIVLWNSTGTSASVIASSTNGLSNLGMSPGISDDGSVAAFYGVDGNGPGVFAAINNGTSFTIVRITGNSDGFDSFSTDTRVGIRSPQGNPPATTLVYIATKNGKQGIYTSLLYMFDTNSGIFYVDRPRLVVEAGDTIFEDSNGNGIYDPGIDRTLTGTAQSFYLFDPINTNADLAFWVQTDSGDQGVIRATNRYSLTTANYHQGDDAIALFGQFHTNLVRRTGCLLFQFLTSLSFVNASFSPST